MIGPPLSLITTRKRWLAAPTRCRLFPVLVASIGVLIALGIVRAGSANGPLYVSLTGDNTADCRSPDTACRTIPGAARKAAEGDTIVVAAGTFTETVAVTQSLTIMGLGQDETILHASPPDFVVTVLPDVTASVSRVTIRGGRGGVFNLGTLHLTNSRITGSDQTRTGGGIRNDGTLHVSDVTIAGNSAVDGGGMANYGTAAITNTTIFSNTARGGGGIANGGHLALTNVTIGRNYAPIAGGGIANSGSARLTNVTLADNDAGEGGNIHGLCCGSVITLTNTLIAFSPTSDNCSGEGIVSAGHNLDNGHTCGFNEPGDLSDTDPGLGPLQANGGPTATRALDEDSPGVDAGDDTACPATDQRGVPRPQGTGCDIGAFEFVPYTVYLPYIGQR